MDAKLQVSAAGRGDGLLRVEGLVTEFQTRRGTVRAVDGIELTVREGKTLALVGESGCGKSVTALSIMRLLNIPPARIPQGRILFEDRDLLSLPERQMRRVRGNRIAMVFQEPMTSLNPVFTCGRQVVEAIELHQKLRSRQAWSRAIDMFEKVGIPDPERRVREYPHQMSGGMRQRVMIAMALSCNPALLIADEPTTALDVTIQAQILVLLRHIQTETGMGILLITHDLGVVAEMAHEVSVMYAGRVVESADVRELFANALHPYTQALLRCLPRLSQRRTRLEVIPESVPDPLDYPSGCRFHPRCSVGREEAQCRESQPEMTERIPGHRVACWKARPDDVILPDCGSPAGATKQ